MNNSVATAGELCDHLKGLIAAESARTVMSTVNEESDPKTDLLTVKEVAGYLRVSRVTAWRWCQQGIIPAFRIGRTWRIPRDELLELKKNRANTTST